MLNTMARHRAKRDQGDAGFTLIELLVVVVIIGILIAIAIPVYLNYRKGANDKSAQSDLRGALTAIEACNSDGGTYPTAAQTDITANYSPCSNQNITFSSGTHYSYATTGSGWKAVTYNSGGTTSKYYCYNSTSTTNSTVTAESGTPASIAAALTAC